MSPPVHPCVPCVAVWRARGSAAPPLPEGSTRKPAGRIPRPVRTSVDLPAHCIVTIRTECTEPTQRCLTGTTAPRRQTTWPTGCTTCSPLSTPCARAQVCAHGARRRDAARARGGRGMEAKGCKHPLYSVLTLWPPPPGAGEGPPATALQEEERVAAAMVHAFEAVDREIMTRCRLEGTKGGATGLVLLRLGGWVGGWDGGWVGTTLVREIASMRRCCPCLAACTGRLVPSPAQPSRPHPTAPAPVPSCQPALALRTSQSLVPASTPTDTTQATSCMPRTAATRAP